MLWCNLLLKAYLLHTDQPAVYGRKRFCALPGLYSEPVLVLLSFQFFWNCKWHLSQYLSHDTCAWWGRWVRNRFLPLNIADWGRLGASEDWPWVHICREQSKTRPISVTLLIHSDAKPIPKSVPKVNWQLVFSFFLPKIVCVYDPKIPGINL